MTLQFIRFFFLVLSTIVGYHIGAIYQYEVPGALYGLAAGALLITIELTPLIVGYCV